MRITFRSTVAPLLLALLLTLATAACGAPVAPTASVAPTTSGAPTATAVPSTPSAVVGAQVQLAGASFVADTAALAAGQAVRFVDPASTGGPHMLCLGHNQICDTSATGPSMLQGAGFRIQAGDPPRIVVFSTAGVYHITCSLHPLMNLTVTVH
jgi:plastocyanin